MMKFNFLHKLLLTNTQVAKIRKALTNGSSANKNCSKSPLSKTIQSGGGVIRNVPIFGNILSSVTKKGTVIARNLRKNFLDEQIDKFNKEFIKDIGSGITITNNETKDIIKVNRGILLKGTTRKITSQEG